jgi:hypothetical protein
LAVSPFWLGAALNRAHGDGECQDRADARGLERRVTVLSDYRKIVVVVVMSVVVGASLLRSAQALNACVR